MLLLAAIGGPKWDTTDPAKPRPEQGLLGIRKELGLYANLRPVRIFAPLAGASSLKPEALEGVDMLIVRELTGGLYFGERGRETDVDGAATGGGAGRRAYDTMEYREYEIERIARTAFEAARGRGGKLSLGRQGQRARVVAPVARGRARGRPRLPRRRAHRPARRQHRDAARARPAQFDVMVTENMFGDILSDEASMLTGSLGMLASASLGDGTALYEPSHGSAPDIAGLGVANPLAMLLSVEMMLRHSLDMPEAADALSGGRRADARRRIPHPRHRGRGQRRRPCWSARRRWATWWSRGSRNARARARARIRARETKEGVDQMAALPKVDKIWMDGALVDWDNAQVHVLTHALHYGSGVFEGIRCYETPDGPAVFRLTEHMERLARSAKMMRMPLPYTVEELVAATLELIAVNKLPACYIRPLVYRGYGVMGLDPLPAPVSVVIAVWPWDTYLGEDALKNGVDAGISSWRQRGVNAVASADQVDRQLHQLVVRRAWRPTTTATPRRSCSTRPGMVCEGTGENIFVVRDEIIVTPPVSDGVLEGITRDSVIAIAQDLGFDIIEASMTRTDLYIADEIFFTGSAAEIVPVRSVDHREIGKPGPITLAIQEAYFNIVRGRDAEYDYWLERV